MQEVDKYKQMWDRTEYRNFAPGEMAADMFVKIAKPREQDWVTDFGCGTGRGAERISKFAKVAMLDFADNCLDFNVRKKLGNRLTFEEHDLTQPRPEAKFTKYGFCFPAGTFVSGEKVNIEDYVVGDTVIGSKGSPQKVLKTFEHRYSGELISIKADCVPGISVTAEHPVLVAKLKRVHRAPTKNTAKAVYEWVVESENWVEAKNVKVGDWVKIPKEGQTPVETDISFDVYSQGGAFKETITARIDAEIAWLFGLYVAEGFVSESPKGRIVFCLGATEQDLADKAICVAAKLGLKARKQQSPSTRAMNGLKVVVDCPGLAKILMQSCGKGAANKKVPDFVIHGNTEIARAFIEGYVAGDGCLRNDKRTASYRYAITTVSKGLAYAVQRVLIKLGVHSAFSKVRLGANRIQGRKVTVKPAYEVQWAKRSWDTTKGPGVKNYYGRCRDVGEAFYAKVNKVEVEEVENLAVYNMHTEDETYCVPFIVHNCTDVMEHIPPEDVETVLRNIVTSCRHCFFQISCVPDHMGELIGEQLHLTVQPYAWWLEQFQKIGCLVHWSQDFGEACAFYVTAWVTGQVAKDRCSVNTEDKVLIEQIKQNLTLGLAEIVPQPEQPGELIILAGGPSLNDFEAEIRLNKRLGVPIVTVNGAYNWALERGINPDAQIVLDAREFNKRFVAPVIPTCKYLIASQCHPELVKALPKGQTFLWHSGQDNVQEAMKEVHAEEEHIWYPVFGGMTVMLRALPLLIMMGYKKFVIYGFDSCIMHDSHHGYAQPENDYAETVEVTCGGRVFKCHGWHLTQAQEWVEIQAMIGDLCEVEVKGDGLISHIVRTGYEIAKQEETKADAA